MRWMEYRTVKKNVKLTDRKRKESGALKRVFQRGLKSEKSEKVKARMQRAVDRGRGWWT